MNVLAAGEEKPESRRRAGCKSAWGVGALYSRDRAMPVAQCDAMQSWQADRKWEEPGS